MRKPTPHSTLYAWHRAAMAGKQPAINQEPHCGWYKRKLVRGGVFVPARIWMYQPICADTGELLADETMQAELNGAHADPHDLWSWVAGNPICEQEFLFLQSTIAWSRDHAPAEPMANPHKAVDWTAVPTPVF